MENEKFYSIVSSVISIMLGIIYVLSIITFTLYLVDSGLFVTEITSNIIVATGASIPIILAFVLVISFFSIAKSNIKEVNHTFETILMETYKEDNVLYEESKKKYIIYNILDNKLKSLARSCFIYLIITSFTIVLYFSNIISINIFIMFMFFYLFMSGSLLARQLLMEYRIRKGLYGNYYSEMLEIVQFIIRNNNKKFKNVFMKENEEIIKILERKLQHACA
jgi:hypothetical protein